MGSFVGSRDDMNAMLGFAADRRIVATVEGHPPAKINGVLDRLRKGKMRLGGMLTL